MHGSTPVTPDDLVGLTEIAKLVGITRSAVSNYRTRDSVDFPEPWGEWAMGSLWLRDEIIVWFDERKSKATATRLRRMAALEAKLARLRSTA